jgi:hypothetical protein
VAELQNPAGRLHELLNVFAQQKGTTQAAWAKALDVSEADVPLHLGDVASLLRDVRRAAEDTGVDAFAPIPAYLQSLSQSIFPVSEPFGGPAGNVAPNGTAMQALAMLSAYLERFAPEGAIPDERERDELRNSVCELIDDVTAADLPADVRRAVLHRLVEVLEALDHLRAGGPDAVRRAAESLAISAILYESDTTSDATIFTRLKSVAHKTWVAFTVTTSLAGAVLTWDRITGLDQLPAGQQRQLPAASENTSASDEQTP